MGMGYGAAWADVIEEGSIIKVGKCKSLITSLKDVLEKAESSIEALAQSLYSAGWDVNDALDNMGIDPDSDEARNIARSYNSLLREFKKQTGLELWLDYHDSSESGDRYDDVDGAFWSVGGYYEISTAAKKAKKKFGIKVERKGFVNFG